jgi:Lytic transglycolase/G5 domain/G5-linked-Ubiquitin-like domain
VVVVVSRETPAAAVTPSFPTGGVWAVGGVSGALREELLAPAETALSADAATGPSTIVGQRVVVMGKVRDVLTNASTVGTLLSAMGIEPDRRDRVLPSPSTPLSKAPSVRYVDVDQRTRKVTSPIPFTTYTTYSSSMSPGSVHVVRQGKPGRFERTYQVRTVDGKVVRKHQVDQHVVEAPVAEHRVVGGSASVAATPPASSQPAPAESGGSAGGSGVEVGEASWYSFAPGSGFTAAHPWLPFGTHVTVTNLENGRSVTVVINDRGPFGGRSIDLSPEAFAQIAPLGQGVAHVRLTW